MNIARSCHLFKQDAEILVLGKARDVEREETAEVIFNGNFNAVMSSELVKMLKEGDEKVIEVAERLVAERTLTKQKPKGPCQNCVVN